MHLVYLNGEFIAEDVATVSVNDRGFLLGDGCYEVTPVYSGSPLRLDQHITRLSAGLEFLRIDVGSTDFAQLHTQLIARNDLEDAPWSMVYLQVTRGSAPRSHGFPPEGTAPTVYGFAKRLARPSDATFAQGSPAIVLPDTRWLKPCIKSINLLPNVLAQQEAIERGAVDVVLHRDEWVTEGTHNNVFIVRDEAIYTPPANELILHGVTRQLVVDLARGLGYDVHEQAIRLEEALEADEVFFTGTTTEIRATSTIDGRAVGSGCGAGPITTVLRERFIKFVTESHSIIRRSR